MLACELDLTIGINVPLKILSSVLVVFFTFAALVSDLLWERYNRMGHQKRRSRRRRLSIKSTVYGSDPDTWNNGSELHSRPVEEQDVINSDYQEDLERVGLLQAYSPKRAEDHPLQTGTEDESSPVGVHAAASSD